MTEQAQFLIPNRRAEVSAFADRFAEFCATHAVPQAVVVTFQLALDEVLTNVADYAWPEGGEHRIEVRIERDSIDRDSIGSGSIENRPGWLCVEVIDDGVAFNPLAEAVAPDTDATIEERAIGGLGVHLMRELMDQVEYRRVDQRNHMIMRKQFKRAP